MEKKDKRNKEIATENTVDDVKRVIKEIDTTETKFGADEDRMMYFFLLSFLRKENYAAVGIDKECDYLKDEEKLFLHRIGGNCLKDKITGVMIYYYFFFADNRF